MAQDRPRPHGRSRTPLGAALLVPGLYMPWWAMPEARTVEQAELSVHDVPDPLLELRLQLGGARFVQDAGLDRLVDPLIGLCRHRVHEPVDGLVLVRGDLGQRLPVAQPLEELRLVEPKVRGGCVEATGSLP